MLNNGNGVFGAASFFEGGGDGEYALNSGDMNNDGIVDLIVGTREDQKIVVLLGNGDGTFTPSTPQNAGGLAWKLVVGEVSGDVNHNLDVAVGNGESNNGAILLGNGDGTLGAPQVLAAPGSAVGSALGDLDGDGDLDLALTDEIADTVTLLKNGATSPCPAAPQLCRAPTVSGKALLKMKNGTPDDKDLVIWKWIKGAATDAAEFGVPTGTDAYTLCLYQNNALVTSATAPAGSNWSAAGDGFSYQSASRTSESVQTIKLKAGGARAAKILFKGKGVDLRMPNLSALAPTLDVQLIKSSGGVCWGATYSAPFPLDDGTHFKAKAD